MNKKLPLLLLGAIALTSCAKTEKLYRENQYNSPIFDENYYVDWEGINNINVVESTSGFAYAETAVQELDSPVVTNGKPVEGYTWGGVPEEQFGYNHNLSKIEKKFNYGVTSKLFDGRVRCEGYYQKSRVQLDKSGFAMYFPKALKQAKYIAFAARGGTDYPDSERFAYPDLKINVKWSFYVHLNSSAYKKVTYETTAVVPVDNGNGGNTAFICLSCVDYEAGFYELYDATAMSFEWEYADTKIQDEINNGNMTHKDLVDDYTQKEKHHLALMLYEVFIGDSIWG